MEGAEVFIWCDHGPDENGPECAAQFVAVVPAGTPDTKAYEEACRQAEMAGWQVDHDKHSPSSIDYCPMHRVVVPGEAMPSA